MLSSVFNYVVQDFKKVSPIRLAKAFAVCASGLTAAAMVAGHAANAYFYANTPTPYDFAMAQGLSYKPETVAYLKQFDDIRVMPVGSPMRDALCSIPNACSNSVKQGGDFAMPPSGILMKMFGMRPFVFLKPYNDKFNETMIYRSTAKRALHSEEKSQAAFKWTTLHELGHIEGARVMGADVYNALPIELREIDADKRAQPHLIHEAGSADGQYSLHFRGLTQFEATHDVLPQIYGPNGKSTTSFQSILDECGVGPINNAKTAPGRLKDIYHCLKSQQANTDDSPELAFRKQSYVAGWEWFFKP